MKLLKRRILSMLVGIAMLGTFLPTALPAVSAADPTTVDAFGIRMQEWTQEEREAAERQTPFGVGYGRKTAMIAKNELFAGYGQGNVSRSTGFYDWSQPGATDNSAGVGLRAVEGSKMKKNDSCKYLFTETAGFDLNGTGKKDHVAQLGTDGYRLELFVTDKDNNQVTETLKFDNEFPLSLRTFEQRGAISLVCGDFNGDGKDTIVVYLPDITTTTKRPRIVEYAMDGKKFKQVSTVTENVFKLLGAENCDRQSDKAVNMPMVSLVAEDTDKDGIDELVVTANINDINYKPDGDVRLGSQMFVFDYYLNNKTPAWNKSAGYDLGPTENIKANDQGRIVWASSTVGNLLVSTNTAETDYPEILSAGFVESTGGYHIAITENIGVVMFQVSGQLKEKKSTGVSLREGGPEVQNTICTYAPVFREQHQTNAFTIDGTDTGDDVLNLMAVQAFADKGYGAQESVFITGTVYRATTEGLKVAYTPQYFSEADNYAQYSSTITDRVDRTGVQDVVAGNFDGNDYGREQLICSTALKKYYRGYQSYTKMYYIWNDIDVNDEGAPVKDGTPLEPGATIEDKWTYTETKDYIAKAVDCLYVNLTALDTGDDSTIVELKEVERTYSEPGVIAILEAPPYFQEIGDGDTGNSQTVFGTSTSSGSGSSHNVGFSVGITVGYEADALFAGGGWELTVDNSFNWGFASNTTQEFSTSFANDTGENLVVVYRSPVVYYHYTDQNGKDMVVTKTGTPATSMIPVDDYNDAVDQYPSQTKLDRITDGLLGEAGNPGSYRQNSQGLAKPVEAAAGADSQSGWIQYRSMGTTEQAISTSQEQENDFTYGLDIGFSAWGTLFGGKLGAQAGLSYEYSTSWMSGKGVNKSGAVTGQQEDGYDFQWRFVTWETTLNGATIPVLGYMVRDVVAPPAPGQNLTVKEADDDSVTLNWERGVRSAQQYRIYRILDDGSYALVGAVSGDKTECTLTQLKPGTTYTYTTRGVAYEEDGDAVESVDGSRITVRTRSADAANLRISMTGAEEGVVKSSGKQANVGVSVVGTPPVGNISYRWQILGTEAGSQWKDLSNGANNEGIDTVSGAASTNLTLHDLDKTVDGAMFRCLVTLSSADGSSEVYYSSSALLDISADTTQTALSIQNAAAGDGTIAVPYTGISDYVIETTGTAEREIQQQVSVENVVNDEEITLSVYETAGDGSDQSVYVGFYDKDDGTTEYYALTEADGSYTVGQQLTEKTNTKWYKGEVSYTPPENFNGQVDTAEIPDVGNAQHMVQINIDEDDGSITSYTEYWVIPASTTEKTDAFYSKIGEDTFIPTAEPTGNGAMRTVMQGSTADMLIVNGDGEGAEVVGAESYACYIVSQGQLTLGDVFRGVTNTGLYSVSEPTEPETEPTETLYVNKNSLSAKMETVIQQEPVINSTPYPGTLLTVSAKVTNKNNTDTVNTPVDYMITNLSTGDSTTLQAPSGQTVTWNATVAGLYRITATAQASATTGVSADTCYYYARSVQPAETPITEYRLLVRHGTQQIDSITYDGQLVSLLLQSRTAGTVDTEPGTWTDVAQDNVTYTVLTPGSTEATPISGFTYAPNAGGVYQFTALVNDTQAATVQLQVNKASITVSPAWGDGGESQETGAPALLADIKPATEDTMYVEDAALLGAALGVSCDLYDAKGNRKDNLGGLFDVTLVYKTGTEAQTAAKELQSKYNVTLQKQTILKLNNAAVVTYGAGENGAITARYSDGTEFAFGSGDSIPMTMGLSFEAQPSDGYHVFEWTVTKNNGEQVDLKNNDNIQIIEMQGMEIQKLTISSLAALFGQETSGRLDVQVTFANASNTITYSVAHSGGGQISAKVGENPLESGSAVAYGANITFTAVPDEGKMIESWTVDGTAYLWPDTQERYRAEVLTLDNVSAGHTVMVTFTNKATTDIYTSVVNESGQPDAGATISAEEKNGSSITAQDGFYTVERDTAVVFTAALAAEGNNTVKEWQTSTDGLSWQTVSNSGGQLSYTHYNPSVETLYVRAVVTAAQTYSLHWDIAAADGGEAPAEADASLKAVSGGQELTNAAQQPAYIPVDFALTLDNAYYVVSWSENVTPDQTDNKKAALGSLTGNMDVTVTIAKKPVITITGPENGTVTVAGTVNGEETTVQSGGYVDFGTALTITAAPNSGYVTDTVNGQAVNAGKENGEKTYTVNTITENTSVSAAFLAKPVISIAGAEGGTIAVTGTVDGAQQTVDDGGYVDFGTALTITAAPNSGYVTDTVNGQAVNAGKENGEKTYTVNTITENTSVSAAFLAKPVISIAGAEGGKIAVTGMVDGAQQVVDDGGYVDFGTELSVTLTPAKGYVVGDLPWFALIPEPVDSDVRTGTQIVWANIAVVPQFRALEIYGVSYAVVDTDDDGQGDFGTLSANVERKGMAEYAEEEDRFAAVQQTTSVYEGGSIVLTAAPEADYRVREWKIGDEIYMRDGQEFFSDELLLTAEELAQYAEANGGSVPQITVQFERGMPRISFANPQNGVLTAAVGGNPFTSGGSTSNEIAFKVEPTEHYEVKEWRVNNTVAEGETSSTFTYMPEGRSVVVEVVLWGETLDISATAGEGGGVTVSPETVRYGDQVTLTAAANTGFAFEGWYLGDTKIEGAAAVYTFTAAEAGAYEARFTVTADNTVSYRVNDAAMGTITAAADEQPFTSGTALVGGQEIVFIVTPEAGYRVKDWNGLPDGAQISTDKNTVTIPALGGSLTVTANLESIPLRTITILDTERGTITAQVNGQDVAQVADGTEVTFTAVPDSYWMFKNWTGDAAEQTESSFTIAVTQNISIGAVFQEAMNYEVTFRAEGANGTVSGTADGIPMTAGETVQQPGGTKLIFTAVPAVGETGYMTAQWTVNGTAVTRDNMTRLGVTVLDMEHHLSNILTVNSLAENLEITVSFEEYQGYDIPTAVGTGCTITGMEKTPAATYAGAPEGEIRKGGDLTFTVALSEGYTDISTLLVNGYDCISNSGTAAGCEKVTAVKGSDGSYTVTVAGVSGEIAVETEAHKLVITNGLEDYVIPESLAEAGIEDAEDIQKKLTATITGSSDGKIFMDIALKYLDTDTGTWLEVSEENFPKGGMNIVIPYPDGTDGKDTFTVAHMIAGGEKAGQVEILEHSKETDGLHFHVDSLSPFAISWTKYKEPYTPSGGGGGGGGTTSYTITFDSQGGSAVENARVNWNATVTKPVDPTREGYVFAGWFIDEACTNAYDFSTKVTKSITLYAKWTEDGTTKPEPTPPTEWKNPFTDVSEGDWFYDAVKYANENGLFAGVSETEFAPDDALTRGMLVTVLWRMEQKPVVNYLMTFEDISGDAYYAEAVRWAASEGIVKGYSETEFAPDQLITREEMAAVINRYADHKGIDTSTDGDLSKFTDESLVADWARSNMEWAVGYGLISGRDDNTLDPQGNTTRAEAALILQRFLEK